MLFDLGQIAFNINRRAYRIIGSGSGRRVYDLGNGYVAKVAKNAKGVAQNSAEHQIYSQDDSNLFAAIIQTSADLHMIIMEKAKRLSHISHVWRYFNVRNNDELYHLPEIRATINRNNLIFDDLRKPQSWGIVHGRPVVVDYGFTWAVNRDYYKR